MHFVAALLVAVGTLFSSFWILTANSWMHTPAGYQVIDGRFFPESWMAIIFNPSFIYRLSHTVSAFYVTTAFVVLGVAAYTVRRVRFLDEGRLMLRLALWFLAIFVPLQMILGDLHGLNTAKYQPAKLAAMEGLWETGRGIPASILGWPNMQSERNDLEIAIPKLGSLYLTHSWNGEVKGLKDFPPDQRPPVAVVYFAFRIMVGVAVLMLGMTACGLALLWRRRLETSVWYLRACQLAFPLGFIAVIAGWITTEVGRQPWTIYGLFKTVDSVSPSLTGVDVLLSLLLYIAVYLIIYPVGLLFMFRAVWMGPGGGGLEESDPIASGRSQGPVRALPSVAKEVAS